MTKYNTQYPSCYDNFIGVNDCDTITPKSGFYIESLEGISIKRAANIADESYQNGVELIKDKIIFALKKLESEVLGKLMLLNYSLPQTTTTQQRGSFKDGLNSTFAGERGLKVYQNNSLSPYSVYTIKKIYIKTQNTQTTTLKIKDKAGNVLWEKDLDLVSNEVFVVEENIRLFGTESFIVLDNTTLTTYKSNTKQFKDCCGYSTKNRPNKLYAVTGWNGLSCEDEGFGIGVEGGMECLVSLVMCDLLPYLSKSALYMAGIEILNEQLASNRLNLINIYSKDWAMEKIEEWRMAVDNELNIIIPNQVKGLKKRDRYCLSCNDRGIKKVQTVKPLFRDRSNTYKPFYRR